MFNTNAFLTGLNKSVLSDGKVLLCDLEGTTIPKVIENSCMIKDFPFYHYEVDIRGGLQ